VEVIVVMEAWGVELVIKEAWGDGIVIKLPVTGSQGCGSGFNDFVDPDWESGSRGKKMRKISTFLVDYIYFYIGKV
jgi:hypothetical protein